ncbi:DgyrCDS4258 [Dimorphilus gyrociliatus]|uniref:DgyrCDS4258 n=1 Tax=Dimorphilus gyrociliatus TaxID=2664684 RepID=A0A7I8VGE5_9ANNE|nr:DgyrCDS4258 [Dimorphilus gyrociliatus]
MDRRVQFSSRPCSQNIQNDEKETYLERDISPIDSQTNLSQDDEEELTNNTKALFQAARCGNINEIDDLLDAPEADINVVWYQENLLMAAIRESQLEMCEFLIDNGIDYNFKTSRIEIDDDDVANVYEDSCRQMAYDVGLTDIVYLIDSLNNSLWPWEKPPSRELRLKKTPEEKEKARRKEEKRRRRRRERRERSGVDPEDVHSSDSSVDSNSDISTDLEDIEETEGEDKDDEVSKSEEENEDSEQSEAGSQFDLKENRLKSNESDHTNSSISTSNGKLLPLRSKSNLSHISSIRMTKASKLQTESNTNKRLIYEHFRSTISMPQRPKTFAFGSYFEESSFWKTSRRAETASRVRTKEGQSINKSTKRKSKRLNSLPLPSIAKVHTPKPNRWKTPDPESRKIKTTSSWWWRRENI